MCGRYYIDNDTLESAAADFPGAVDRISSGNHAGEILPSCVAPVIGAYGAGLCFTEQRWGFPKNGGKGPVINARAETVSSVRLFAGGISSHRIAVPAGGFYEWNALKEKYTFTRPEGGPMYLAGIADMFENEPRFVILTTAANASMIKVHDRMPLILEKNQVADWILDGSSTAPILTRTPVVLKADAEYEQQSLF